MSSGNLISSMRKTEFGTRVGVKRTKGLVLLLEPYLAELRPG